jgi:hypothetical protein
LGKPEEKRPLRKWEVNIMMDIGETGWGMDWILLAYDQV